MIDQNTIILVLILIVILLSFYSAYLSMDNSRKIKKLQSELKNTLTILNETLNIKDQLNPDINLEQEPQEKPQIHKPNKEDLSRYPSLDELGSFEPLDNNIKDAIDNLQSQENGEEVLLEEVTNEEETIQEYDNDNNIDDKENLIDENNLDDLSNELEDISMEELSKNRNLPEDVEENNEEKVVENDNSDIVDNIVEDVVSDAINEVVDSELNNNEENENLQESKDVEVTFPELNDLDKELLASYSLKNIKSICKREDLRLSGSKSQLIERILKKKEFKVEI